MCCHRCGAGRPHSVNTAGPRVQLRRRGAKRTAKLPPRAGYRAPRLSRGAGQSEGFPLLLDGASATADAWGHRTLCGGGGGAVCLVAHGGAAMKLLSSLSEPVG